MLIKVLLILVACLSLISCASNTFSTVDFKFNSLSEMPPSQHILYIPTVKAVDVIALSELLRQDGATSVIREVYDREFSVTEDNIRCFQADKEISVMQKQAFAANDFSKYKSINLLEMYEKHSVPAGCGKITWTSRGSKVDFLQAIYQRPNGISSRLSMYIQKKGDGIEILAIGQPVAVNGVAACNGCSVPWSFWRYFDGSYEQTKVRSILTLINDTILDERIAKENTKPEVNVVKKTGTSFLVAPQGIFATNYHVIDQCSSLMIDGLPAKIVMSDKKNDIALLSVKKNYGKSVSLRTNFKMGEEVFVYGFPLTNMLGTELSVTKGIVSSMTGLDGDTTTFRLSAPIQAGNSGGPIVDKDGDVVGVVVATLNNEYVAQVTGGQSQNVNFGIKASLLENVLDSYGIKTAKVTTGNFGLDIHLETTKLVLCN